MAGTEQLTCFNRGCGILLSSFVGSSGEGWSSSELKAALNAQPCYGVWGRHMIAHVICQIAWARSVVSDHDLAIKHDAIVFVYLFMIHKCMQ